jgi:hypothetical protein
MTKINRNNAVALFFLTLLLTSLILIPTSVGLVDFAYVNPPETNVNVCQTFAVTVVASVSYQIDFFEFYLYFNPAQVAFVNAMAVPPWAQTGLIVGPNYVWVQGTDGSLGPGQVQLGQVTFHCIAPGTSTLTLYSVEVHKVGAGGVIYLPTQNGIVNQYSMYWKPGDLTDYAPSGVPDFDQKQDNWKYPQTPQWSYCGPTAIANSFWWLDSFYESNPVAPPKINDNFPLVWSYNSGQWDDHDPRNVGPLINDLAMYMDTDGIRSGVPHIGTNILDMASGINQYLLDHGLNNKFYEKTVKAPDFHYIESEVERCEDVTLLLGFWQTDGVNWWRVGGHYVTVAGVDSVGLWIAFSDPFVDNAEAGGPGVVLPGAHGYPHPANVHNDTLFVSHDIYVAQIPGPGHSPGNPMFEVSYNKYEVVDWNNLISNMTGENCPSEFQLSGGPYNQALAVYTEVEYAVIVSCETGIVAAGSQDTNVYVFDFFGNPQWSFATAAPVLSVAFDNDAKYLVSGSRILPDGPGFLCFFDAHAVTGGGINVPLWMMQLPISESYDGGWMGTESKSVDTKYNYYNQQNIVAAATDSGLYLFDQAGNLIWQYYDQSPETIVRISQDGNFIVCVDYNTGIIHYFSHLHDGTPGWGPEDGTPVWSFGGGVYYAFWVAISGIGDYVAASVYPNPVIVNPMTTGVVLLDRTGNIVWFWILQKGGYVRVDMPCIGRSVVSVNDDPSNGVGCDLTYWSDGGNGWDAGDANPVWSYWPGKELGSGQNPTDDFYTVAISENGDYIATGGIPKNTYLLQNDGTLQQTIGLMLGAIQSVDLTFTGKYGAAVDNAGLLWFFNKDTGLVWAWADLSEAPFHCVAVSKIYPCMFPYPNHDVAITNVATSKDGCDPIPSVGQNNTVHINVTVFNAGDFAETSQVTVYVNNTLIGTTTVSNLASKAQTQLTFIWDTTGFTKGYYVIHAYASIVPNEINVLDNNRVGSSQIQIVLPGDINCDMWANAKDAVLLGKAFNSNRGQPHFNPNADINDDDWVNAKDAIILGKHFNEHDP